jgi:RNA polymerase sigma-70 factor (ECF subfamily)
MMAISQDHRQWVLAALNEYEQRLTRYAARLLRDDEAARDVVQHVFLRLCQQRPDDLDGRVALWLFTVCRNRVIDIVRQRERTESFSGQAEARVFGSELDPSHLIERGELHQMLRRLVDELPDKQREVVGLLLQGFTHREISEITQRTEGYVRLLIHRALKRLRDHPRIRKLLEDRNESGGAVFHQPSRERSHAIKLA